MAVAKLIAATSTTVVSATPGVMLYGWSVRENAGTPAVATVELWDNASAATGTMLASIVLAASGNDQVNFPTPIRAKNGIFATVTAGTIKGSAYID